MDGRNPTAMPASSDGSDRRLDDLLGQLKAVRDGRRQSLDANGSPQLEEIALLVNQLLARRAAAPAANSASVLEYIIANVPHSIFWKDFEGRFLGGNRNLLRDLGLNEIAELVGKTDYDLGFPREQADFFRRCDLDVMTSGRALMEIEEPQDQADGTHTLLTSKVPLRDERGQVNGMLGIYVDITERKRIEEALRVARDEAEAASRAKSDFLTVISHEVRTPLTLILGPLDGLLAHPDLAPEARADLLRIRRNAGRLLVLVNDLLTFNLIEAGRMEVEWELGDPGELVGQLVADALPAAGRAGLALSLALDEGPGKVPLDRRKLEKIALNLIGNALKFTPAGGRVEVAVRGEGASWWELSVADTGPGIAREQQPLLFQRFRQLDTGVRRQHEGSGIGLALVKELAACMGGEVGLESDAGAGARFFVRLPRSVDRVQGAAALREATVAEGMAEHALRLLDGIASSPQPPPAAPVRRAEKERSRVLLVDDNADMRAWLAGLLGRHYEVDAAADGEAALEQARTRAPDVIVADVMMPRMDGFEMLRRLKADSALRHVPVLLLTARAGRDEIVAGLDVGADDYLPKPFSPAELLARVRTALRLHEAWEELSDEHRALLTAHDQLRAAHDQLVRSARTAAVGTLVAGLCHELNNPLTVILLNAQALLARGGLGADAAGPLGAIERNTHRCAQLVSGLLEFSRKKQPVREELDMGVVFERLGLLLAARLRRIGARLVCKVDLAPDHRVLVCRQDIETVLLGVVGNALDVTADGGQVELRAHAAASDRRSGVELSVHDHGPGIPADVLPHVFDPFFTTKKVGSATGLGLSVARKIVDDHGGSIEVETGASGTTVRIWLPATPAEVVSDPLSRGIRP